MNSKELAETARMLSKLEPGFLPFDIFQQIARLVALPIVEIVPLRQNARGETEILLLERDIDDPHFAGQLHTSGVVVLSTDTPGTFDSAFGRILSGELRDTRTSEPRYVYHLLHHSDRGMESAHIFWVEVLGKPKVGTFYGASALPRTLMASQSEFITEAILNYEQYKAQLK